MTQDRARLMGASGLSTKALKGSGPIIVYAEMDKAAQKDVLLFLHELGGGRAFKSQIKKGLKDGIEPVWRSVIGYVPVLTGALKRYYQFYKHRAIKKISGTRGERRGVYAYSVVMPERQYIGIPRPDKKNDENWYYPIHVHDGHDNVKGIPFAELGAKAAETRAQSIFWQTVEKYILKKLRGKAK